MTDNERRAHSRAPAHNVVTYITVGKKRVTAAIENISSGGVLLRSSMVVGVGTDIGLEFFESESKKTLAVEGTVLAVVDAIPGTRQQSVPGLSVKFGHLTMDHHRRMGALIDALQAARQTDTFAKIELQRAAPPSAPKPAPGDSGSGMPAVKRRRNRRVPTRDATAHVRMKGDIVALSVPVTNVSMGGLFLQTADRLPVGAAIDVELRLGGQSMVISGAIVGEVAALAGAARGMLPGLSMRFGPMPRRTADRLRQALAALAPLAADGLAQEVLPGGYEAEKALPASAVSMPTASMSKRAVDFDFAVKDLQGYGELNPVNEDLPTELARLKSEVRVREERISMIERMLRDQQQP